MADTYQLQSTTTSSFIFLGSLKAPLMTLMIHIIIQSFEFWYVNSSKEGTEC